MLGKKAYLKVLLDLGFWKLSMWIERESVRDKEVMGKNKAKTC